MPPATGPQHGAPARDGRREDATAAAGEGCEALGRQRARAGAALCARPIIPAGSSPRQPAVLLRRGPPGPSGHTAAGAAGHTTSA